MSTHSPECGCDAFACQLRHKGVQISPAATPTSRKGTPGTNAEYNGWERGIVSQERPGGARMPYLSAEGSPIRTKAFAEGKYDKALDKVNAARQKDS